eukprot:TRINITY_DN13229_c0_g1_i1.p3 TRINITY_DN13229_c0_g1~~TRINITY_DN13229_c0_g1_i1.p3  ORF type:complete len:60 (+),score=8.94 TRINITY_DN13229_c0_g1_i1:112-291(+)
MYIIHFMRMLFFPGYESVKKDPLFTLLQDFNKGVEDVVGATIAPIEVSLSVVAHFVFAI